MKYGSNELILAIAVIAVGIGYFCIFRRKNERRLMREYKRNWDMLDKGLCPGCGKEFKMDIGKFECDCGCRLPEEIKEIDGQCSFCGGVIINREAPFPVAEGKRTIYRPFLGCARCKSWIEKPKLPQTMEIVNGICGFCRGEVEKIEEARLDGTPYKAKKCKDCGLFAIEALTDNPEDYEPRPYYQNTRT